VGLGICIPPGGFLHYLRHDLQRFAIRSVNHLLLSETKVVQALLAIELHHIYTNVVSLAVPLTAFSSFARFFGFGSFGAASTGTSCE
jgi:hypothetical protein